MSNAHKGGFSEADKEVAGRAWDVYMYDINAPGLRWEFDGRPGRMEYVIGRGASHLSEIDRFVDRIRRFGGFVADLTAFKDRPITRPYPFGWPDTITRNIGDQEIATYGRLHSAVVDYAGVLLKHGPGSPEVIGAATTAAQVVNPEAWREVGAAVPTDIAPYSRLGTRWYLEAVIAQSK